MKPICVACQRFFRPTKNGIEFVEGAPIGNDAPPGTVAPERWRPYKLWMGDKWQCPSCSHTIIVGVGREPVSEHYKPDFQKQVAAGGGAHLMINDC